MGTSYKKAVVEVCEYLSDMEEVIFSNLERAKGKLSEHPENESLKAMVKYQEDKYRQLLLYMEQIGEVLSRNGVDLKNK